MSLISLMAFNADHEQYTPAGFGTSDSYSPDALMAAAAYVQREYGVTGYRIEPRGASLLGGGLFCVHHSDGSTFLVQADRFGNANTV
jgi:hypothetical protein